MQPSPGCSNLPQVTQFDARSIDICSLRWLYSDVREDAMRVQKLAARYEHSISTVFAALAMELGRERWLQRQDKELRLPQAGLEFGYRRRQRCCTGKVLECLRPVSIILVERHQGPAGCIIARQRWRVEPLDAFTRLRCELQIQTNRFARLQQRFWHRHLRILAQRTCQRVATRLHHDSVCQSDSIGQRSGSSSIVNANTTRVSGRPILR